MQWLHNRWWVQLRLYPSFFLCRIIVASFFFFSFLIIRLVVNVMLLLRFSCKICDSTHINSIMFDFLFCKLIHIDIRMKNKQSNTDTAIMSKSRVNCPSRSTHDITSTLILKFKLNKDVRLKNTLTFYIDHHCLD